MDCFLSNRVSRPIIAIIHLESQFNICVFNNTIFLKSIGAKVDLYRQLFTKNQFHQAMKHAKVNNLSTITYEQVLSIFNSYLLFNGRK